MNIITQPGFQPNHFSCYIIECYVVKKKVTITEAINRFGTGFKGL